MRLLRPAALVLGAYNLALALFMALDPHGFFDAIGPFGAYNRHYIGDAATWQAALGIAFLIASRRPSWRLPVFAFAAIQSAIHTVNHLIDIDNARPGSPAGWLDATTLAAATLILGYLAFRAHRCDNLSQQG